MFMATVDVVVCVGGGGDGEQWGGGVTIFLEEKRTHFSECVRMSPVKS